jgi:hypothetical protein
VEVEKDSKECGEEEGGIFGGNFFVKKFPPCPLQKTL